MSVPGIPTIPAIPPVQGKAEMALDAARVYAEEEAKRKRLECRFYEAQYPEIEEVVMVNVRNIAEMGAYVVLLEYNDIEGMILLSELSRRRIRSINKLIRVNRNEVAMVLRVDKEKVMKFRIDLAQPEPCAPAISCTVLPLLQLPKAAGQARGFLRRLLSIRTSCLLYVRLVRCTRCNALRILRACQVGRSLLACSFAMTPRGCEAI